MWEICTNSLKLTEGEKSSKKPKLYNYMNKNNSVNWPAALNSLSICLKSGSLKNFLKGYCNRMYKNIIPNTFSTHKNLRKQNIFNDFFYQRWSSLTLLTSCYEAFNIACMGHMLSLAQFP